MLKISTGNASEMKNNQLLFVTRVLPFLNNDHLLRRTFFVCVHKIGMMAPRNILCLKRSMNLLLLTRVLPFAHVNMNMKTNIRLKMYLIPITTG